MKVLKACGLWMLIVMGWIAIALDLLLTIGSHVRKYQSGRLTWDPAVGWFALAIFLLTLGLILLLTWRERVLQKREARQSAEV